MDEAMQRYFAEKNVARRSALLRELAEHGPTQEELELARNFFAGLFKKSGIWT